MFSKAVIEAPVCYTKGKIPGRHEKYQKLKRLEELNSAKKSARKKMPEGLNFNQILD